MEKTELKAERGGAYLVVADEKRWRDVFRLTPGQVTTIGRAPTNRIVLHDEICSRNHCEVFQSGNQWTVRDLGSRNGTTIDGTPLEGDWELKDGETIEIGSCDLGFTFDVVNAFPHWKKGDDSLEEQTETAEFRLDDEVLPPEIIHRKRRTRYDSREPLGRDRISRELTRLYRLAFAMSEASNAQGLGNVVLDGLFASTGADIGAVLLLPKGVSADAKTSQLEAVAYKTLGDQDYQKVSKYLSTVVLSEWEAVLARDIADDSRLAGRDSLGEIFAKSVICAPVRVENTIYGLIHLYSTDADKLLEPDDLEFTLAVADQMAQAISNLQEKQSLEHGLARAQDEAETLRQQLGIDTDLVGDSSSMQELQRTITMIAPTDATVLVLGESGVGKELVSRAIHFNSDRRNGPFVCMNCAALSETLLESELFGHEKGSFTGATGRKIGKFEQAHEGTLFLDEVGEMSLAIQAKFLRVLEGHPFERVGGGTSINVDVRVVAATNRNLEKAVQQKEFRNDLYFRLNVVIVNVEPLRDHVSDIPTLAEYFLERFVRKAKRNISGFTDGALDVLKQYDWPGNVRELQNTIERTVILCSADIITESNLQLSVLGRNNNDAREYFDDLVSRDISLDLVEKQHILAVLERTEWNKSRAAQILEIERSTLDRKLKKYNVKRP